MCWKKFCSLLLQYSYLTRQKNISGVISENLAGHSIVPLRPVHLPKCGGVRHTDETIVV